MNHFVQVVSETGITWTHPSRNDDQIIPEGSTIFTAPNSSIEMVHPPNGVVISLCSGSELNIEQIVMLRTPFERDKMTSVLKLDQGRVFVSTASQPGVLVKIKTSSGVTASCSEPKSIFSITAMGRIRVYQGVVDVNFRGRFVLLVANHQMDPKVGKVTPFNSKLPAKPYTFHSYPPENGHGLGRLPSLELKPWLRKF